MMMKKCAVAVLAIILSFSGAHKAHADQMLAVGQIRPVVEWVEARTNLMLLPRPRVYISTDALLRLTAATNTAKHPQIAAYRNGAIFISEKYWQSDDIADQSVLVHELVHYAQDLGHQTYVCANQREEEAYRLQNEFLVEHGERPYLEHADMERLKTCG